MIELLSRAEHVTQSRRSACNRLSGGLLLEDVLRKLG